MSEWIAYTGGNPPTDTSKHRLWESQRGGVTYTLSRRAGEPILIPTENDGARWRYVEPYTPPAPEMPEEAFLSESEGITGTYGTWQEEWHKDCPHSFTRTDTIERDYVTQKLFELRVEEALNTPIPTPPGHWECSECGEVVKHEELFDMLRPDETDKAVEHRCPHCGNFQTVTWTSMAELAGQATPDEELLRQLMDPTVSKTEREHFAARTIAERDKTIAEYDAMIDGMADANLAMRKRIKELEADLKDFRYPADYRDLQEGG